MIELGKIQTLTVIQHSDFGVYLSYEMPQDEIEINKVLLPKGQVPAGTELGDKIEVFVHRDTEDRLIATIEKPLLTVGEVAKLEVAEITKIGAFLKWGPIKDLLLPFKEQVGTVEIGQSYVVGMYIDKTDRLCATMKVYDILQSHTPFQVNKVVNGLVYKQNEENGVFVAVEGKYHGLIPKKEIYKMYEVGEEIEARIQKIRPDGKLELSTRRQVNGQMEVDARFLLDELKKADGFLPLNDKSNPDAIKKRLKMSKASFKRAVGRLLKEGAIEFEGNGIRCRIL